MEPKTPDFKDWHELKNKKKEIFLANGESFLRLNYYIKYESIEKIFEGTNWLFYGKEIVKAWIGPDSSGKKNQKLIALLLEDGNWTVSLPFYREQDAPKFFNITPDVPNHSVQINILTESGWKSRMIKIKVV